MFSEKVWWLIYLVFGLFFLFRFLTTEELLFQYIFLVLGVFDISMLITRSGLYNYNNKSYKWLEYDE